MGGLFSSCFGPSPPPVVFTVCQSDGKAHDFGAVGKGGVDKLTTCNKCGKSRGIIDMECQECQSGSHRWVQDFEPIPQQQPQVQNEDPKQALQPGVVKGTPVQVVQKCERCGLREQTGANGARTYDDHYMYGGGHMMGLEMGLMFGIMGASDHAYADPMYNDYYGGDSFAADGGGFDADDGGGGGDFDFD